jgi:hypothetical protein
LHSDNDNHSQLDQCVNISLIYHEGVTLKHIQELYYIICEYVIGTRRSQSRDDNDTHSQQVTGAMEGGEG